MYRNLAENKPSSSSPISEKIEAYYSDEIVAIWKNDDKRNWKVYEKLARLTMNWERV